MNGTVDTARLAEQGDQPEPLFPLARGPQQVGLFEGYGGLSLAVGDVLGAELVAYSEIDPAASKLLAHHHPAVPNLGDITAIDWRQVAATLNRSRAVIVTGGFPCQDLSLAGVGKGLRPGTRSGLWTHMAYGIDQLRPDLVVIENVRGLLSADAACDLEPCPWCLGDDEGRPLRALGAVLGDLAELGYDARWVGLRAADVGAPHGRFRVFIAAWPAADPDRDAVREQSVAERGGSRAAVAEQHGQLGQLAADPVGIGCGTARRDDGVRPAGLESSAVADSDSVGPIRCGDTWGGWRGPENDDLPASDAYDAAGDGERARPEPRDGGEAPADPGRDGREGRTERHLRPEGGQPAPHGGDPAGRVLGWGDYEPAIRRWESVLGRVAPAPTQTGARGGTQLSARFVEWLMGLPAGYVTDVPGLSRNDQLARLGNGVVPQQAAAALRHLLNADAVGMAA